MIEPFAKLSAALVFENGERKRIDKESGKSLFRLKARRIKARESLIMLTSGDAGNPPASRPDRQPGIVERVGQGSGRVADGNLGHRLSETRPYTMAAPEQPRRPAGTP